MFLWKAGRLESMYTHFFPLSEAVEFLLAQFPLLSTDYKIFDQTN